MVDGEIVVVGGGVDSGSATVDVLDTYRDAR